VRVWIFTLGALGGCWDTKNCSKFAQTGIEIISSEDECFIREVVTELIPAQRIRESKRAPRDRLAGMDGIE